MSKRNDDSIRSPFTIRDFRAADMPQLAELYEQTVRRWGPAGYSPEQVEAWASVPKDRERFDAMVLVPRTFVAVDASGRPVGFAGVETDGRIASLYVAADWTRCGVGSALLHCVIDFAAANQIGPLWSEASQFSRPLFERHGFAVASTETIVFNDVEFERWIVRHDG